MKSALATSALLLAFAVSPAVANTAQKNVEPKKIEKKETKAVEKKEVSHQAASSTEQMKLQKEAKIPMSKAKSIALGRVRQGTIERSELEREHGKLIYSFDIREAARKDITEVNVDAMNGKIVAVEHENMKKEAAEKRMETGAKHRVK